MYDSANLIDFQIPRKRREIREDIRTLILKNKVDRLNVKLLAADVDHMGKVFLVYNIESFYPSKEYYIKGIHTTLFYYERDNPNAKVLVTSFKEDVAKALKEKEAFEALLVNKSGYIPRVVGLICFVKGDKYTQQRLQKY